MREYLQDEYNSWEEFAQAIQAIPVDRLLADHKHQEEDNQHDKTIASLQQQLAQLSIQPSQASRSTPTSAILVNLAPAPILQCQATAGIAQTQLPTAPARSPLTCNQILERVAGILHCPDTEEGWRQYKADVAAWHNTHRQTTPNIDRPYPLTPGMAPLGSSECYNCGRATAPIHTSGTCPMLESQVISLYEQCYHQAIGVLLQKASTIACTLPVPVQYIWAVPPPQIFYNQPASANMMPSHSDLMPAVEQEVNHYGSTETWLEVENLMGPLLHTD